MKGRKTPPTPPKSPLKIETQIEEIEDDSRAADLVEAILRAQARTAARKAATKEQRDDAA